MGSCTNWRRLLPRSERSRCGCTVGGHASANAICSCGRLGRAGQSRRSMTWRGPGPCSTALASCPLKIVRRRPAAKVCLLDANRDLIRAERFEHHAAFRSQSLRRRSRREGSHESAPFTYTTVAFAVGVGLRSVPDQQSAAAIGQLVSMSPQSAAQSHCGHPQHVAASPGMSASNELRRRALPRLAAASALSAICRSSTGTAATSRRWRRSGRQENASAVSDPGRLLLRRSRPPGSLPADGFS